MVEEGRFLPSQSVKPTLHLVSRHGKGQFVYAIPYRQA